MLPASTAGRYFAIGFGTGGKVKRSSCKRSSGVDMFRSLQTVVRDASKKR
jgi:hypothetical protein